MSPKRSRDKNQPETADDLRVESGRGRKSDFGVSARRASSPASFFSNFTWPSSASAESAIEALVTTTREKQDSTATTNTTNTTSTDNSLALALLADGTDPQASGSALGLATTTPKLNAGGNKCGKCQNHDVERSKKGHARDCPFKKCNCLKCRLLDARSDILQVISGKETKLKGTKKDPNCGFCQNHCRKVLRKGHVRSCSFGQEHHFRLENCFDCEVHYIRNEVNRLQIKMRRAMKEDRALSEEQKKTAREAITRDEVEKVCEMAREARSKRDAQLARRQAKAEASAAANAVAAIEAPPQTITSTVEVPLPIVEPASSESSDSSNEGRDRLEPPWRPWMELLELCNAQFDHRTGNHQAAIMGGHHHQHHLQQHQHNYQSEAQQYPLGAVIPRQHLQQPLSPINALPYHPARRWPPPIGPASDVALPLYRPLQSPLELQQPVDLHRPVEICYDVTEETRAESPIRVTSPSSDHANISINFNWGNSSNGSGLGGTHGNHLLALAQPPNNLQFINTLQLFRLMLQISQNRA